MIYMGENLHFNDAYVIAVLFAANLYGFQGISAYFTRTLHRWSPLIRWGAGATFSIYLMHYPLALFLGAIAVWPPGSWQTRLFISGGTVLGVFAFAAVTERRKDRWRRGETFLANRLVPAMATRP
jgi:peptidoglycan/LPS O-acetylase OafA/YrhL